MSIPAIALTALQGGGLLALQTLLGTGSYRTIGPISADVTVEEEHHDELFITLHPVEQGAAISDHAFKMPARVRIKAGWSQGGKGMFGNDGLAGLASSAVAIVPTMGDPSYLADIYANLLNFQESAQLLTIVTGKRLYDNMLIRELSVTTDQRTENALLVEIECQEVIIVQTQTVQMAPATNQASPQKTAPVQDMGTQQPIAVGT